MSVAQEVSVRLLHPEQPRGRDCFTRLPGGSSYRGNSRASAAKGPRDFGHAPLVRPRGAPPWRSLTSRALRGMQGLRLGQYGGPKTLCCEPYRGIVDARRRLLPALTARLQRERTVITATSCDHRLKLGLEPTAAARRRAGGMTPALSLAQRPSQLRANRLPTAGAQGGCGRHRLDGRDADGVRPAPSSRRRCSSAWFFKSRRRKPPARLQQQPTAADRSGSPCASAALGAHLAGVAHGRGRTATGVRS